VPVECVGQKAAEQGADGAAAGTDEAEHAHRLGAIAGLREQIHDQRQRDRIDDRTTQTLYGARGDQDELRTGQSARERGQREQPDAEQEQAPMAVEIAEPAAEQQESAGGQQIRVDDPGQRAFGKSETLADRRQRDVHDRHVEHDHQDAETQDGKCEPAAALVGTLRVLLVDDVRRSHRQFPSG
jgi:hypothetical protein